MTGPRFWIERGAAWQPFFITPIFLMTGIDSFLPRAARSSQGRAHFRAFIVDPFTAAAGRVRWSARKMGRESAG